MSSIPKNDSNMKLSILITLVLIIGVIGIFMVFKLFGGENKSVDLAAQFPNLKKVTLVPPMNADLSVPKEDEFTPIKEMRAMKIKAEYL